VGRQGWWRCALVWIIASAVLGAAATFLSGEWRTSWSFLLVDIPLVAGSAVLAYAISRRLTLRWRRIT
jgi:phage-related holin